MSVTPHLLHIFLHETALEKTFAFEPGFCYTLFVFLCLLGGFVFPGLR